MSLSSESLKARLSDTRDCGIFPPQTFALMNRFRNLASHPEKPTPYNPLRKHVRMLSSF